MSGAGYAQSNGWLLEQPVLCLIDTAEGGWVGVGVVGILITPASLQRKNPPTMSDGHEEQNAVIAADARKLEHLVPEESVLLASPHNGFAVAVGSGRLKDEIEEVGSRLHHERKMR